MKTNGNVHYPSYQPQQQQIAKRPSSSSPGGVSSVDGIITGSTEGPSSDSSTSNKKYKQANATIGSNQFHRNVTPITLSADASVSCQPTDRMRYGTTPAITPARAISSSNTNGSSSNDRGSRLSRSNYSSYPGAIIPSRSPDTTSPLSVLAGSAVQQSNAIGAASTTPLNGDPPSQFSLLQYGSNNSYTESDDEDEEDEDDYEEEKSNYSTSLGGDSNGAKDKGAKTASAKGGRRSIGFERHDRSLATVAGQLALNPNLTHHQARAAAKREYNRQNAARARVRHKDRITKLKAEYDKISALAKKLQRENDILRSQVEILLKTKQVSSPHSPHTTTESNSAAPAENKEVSIETTTSARSTTQAPAVARPEHLETKPTLLPEPVQPELRQLLQPPSVPQLHADIPTTKQSQQVTMAPPATAPVPSPHLWNTIPSATYPPIKPLPTLVPTAVNPTIDAFRAPAPTVINPVVSTVLPPIAAPTSADAVLNSIFTVAASMLLQQQQPQQQQPLQPKSPWEQLLTMPHALQQQQQTLPAPVVAPPVLPPPVSQPQQQHSVLPVNLLGMIQGLVNTTNPNLSLPHVNHLSNASNLTNNLRDHR